MHIKKKTYQDRRDFRAIFACEHCGHEYEDWGYDDVNFHQYVVPLWRCPGCDKTADAMTPKTIPDVPAHVTI